MDGDGNLGMKPHGRSTKKNRPADYAPSVFRH